MSFNDLGLSAELLRAVSDQGYSNPTPIQAKAIPIILQGLDVLAGAQTGTGKTAGFTLPLLHRLSSNKPTDNNRRPVRALVLTPTRELAAQVAESVVTYGKHLPLKSGVIFGGVNINPQISMLRRGVDILIATPGRLLDHVNQRTLDLSQVEILVLDEADRMLDMGFIHDIRKVLALLPKQRQNLLFSATFSDEIKRLADGLLNAPVLIEVARRNTASEQVAQTVHLVDKGRKRELLSYLIGDGNWQQVLVFTRTKHGANRLADQLTEDGLRAAAIHGNKSQGARTKALADFKKGSVRVLVATDIAARGLDIDQLPHVVNFELPNVPEDYVHRIGRTGRAGNEGEAVSLVCVDEHKLLRDIERVLKREVPRGNIKGFEPDLSIRPEPIQNGRRSGGGGRPGASAGARRPGSKPQHARSTGSRNGGNATGDRRRSAGAKPTQGAPRPRRAASR
ncbi:MAG: ATP-dependent RNA helicase RhlE [Porticoccus sp.]|jgi:ATP-dependent RNA helicase RhlE|uniref:ATP-dependent RNA helicase RhlE n=1 Tax=Porticoccus hydrocarbonoclasticus TaxID=1073414 RepID=UPI0005628EC1|nr:ATP-dependent RNA helicase RhlE [Porticoccus hydrocarbonoclasticus]MBG57080.1 ATP-dependent RNA helicase RhlE [Porticoccus sp.]|tara:strand:- start:830 stop:2185 length:1356 start_codon:yes stop_codon:yes gene_type:complete